MLSEKMTGNSRAGLVSNSTQCASKIRAFRTLTDVNYSSLRRKLLKVWGERWDLNPRPSVPQTDALPAELRSPLKINYIRWLQYTRGPKCVPVQRPVRHAHGG